MFVCICQTNNSHMSPTPRHFMILFCISQILISFSILFIQWERVCPKGLTSPFVFPTQYMPFSAICVCFSTYTYARLSSLIWLCDVNTYRPLIVHIVSVKNSSFRWEVADWFHSINVYISGTLVHTVERIEYQLWSNMFIFEVHYRGTVQNQRQNNMQNVSSSL